MSNDFKVESEINEPFVIIPKDIMVMLDVYDLAVYSHLKGYMNYQTKKCYPSLNRLKEEIGIGKDRLIKSIRSLEQKGFISIEKEQNSVNKYTFLDFKAPSRSNRPPKEVVVETDSGSRLERPQVVVETDTNKKNLTKRNKENKEREKPSKPFFENLDKKEFIKQAKKDNELCKRWLGQKLKSFKEQYPREFLEYYYKQLTYTDDIQEVSKLMTYFRKNNTFGIGNSLANWFKNWKPINNQTNQPKTYAQLEREDYREQMKRIQETYDSFDDMLLNEVVVYE